MKIRGKGFLCIRRGSSSWGIFHVWRCCCHSRYKWVCCIQSTPKNCSFAIVFLHLNNSWHHELLVVSCKIDKNQVRFLLQYSSFPPLLLDFRLVAAVANPRTNKPVNQLFGGYSFIKQATTVAAPQGPQLFQGRTGKVLASPRHNRHDNVDLYRCHQQCTVDFWQYQQQCKGIVRVQVCRSHV